MTPAFFRRKGTERRDGKDRDRRTDAPATKDAPTPDARAHEPAAPAGRSVAPQRDALVETAVATWRERLVALGGASTLADLHLLGEAVIDLTTAHPSGLAQLYAGRTTRLSSLVREGGAQQAARRRARTVRAHAEELRQRHGVAPTYLAIGVATWTELPAPGAPDFTDTGEVVLEVSSDPRHAHADHARSAASAPSPQSAASPQSPASPQSAASAVSTPPAPGSAASGSSPAASAGEAPADLPRGGFPSPPGAVEPAPLETDEPALRSRVRTVHAPVLLRPVRLISSSGAEDVAFQLEAAIEVNPVLVRALRAAMPRGEDVAAIARTAYTEEGFAPRSALARLAELGRQYLPGFELTETLLVGPFLQPGQILVDDLDAMRPHLAVSDVVAALAGDEKARSALAAPLPPRVPADRPPEEERGVGDLDPDQAHAVDVVASGRHVFLDAPPGADVLGTVAAIAADAAASRRVVTYVPGSRRTGRALAGRLRALGLDDLVIDVATDDQWRAHVPERLRAALDRASAELDDEAIQGMREELAEVRGQLADYIDGLHAAHEPWGVSAYDALQELAGLTSARPGPRSRVRLDGAALQGLDREGLEDTRDLLVRASALGAFTLRAHDTPWYGARLADAAEATQALERTQRLADLGLPKLIDQVSRVTRQTGLERATTLEEWREQLLMLDGVAEALDVFQPQIFERSAADMVIATATRTWRRENGLSMKGGMRRRLRKQAKDMLRPGRPVEDLHAELVRVQEQREIWRRHNPAGGWPRLPDGLAEIKETEQEVRAEVEALQGVVGSGAGKEDLLGLPLSDLRQRMKELSGDAAALHLLPERTQVLEELSARGLDPLVEDLTQRRVGTALVAAELDLVWWSSVLVQILRTVPALAGFDGPALQTLVARFRELDEAQVASLVGPVRRAIVEFGRERLAEAPQEAEGLAMALEEPHADLRGLLARSGRAVAAICPLRLVAPTLLPQLHPAQDESIDLLVLDGVQHLPVEQAISLLARARQVVVVGDSRRGGDGLVGALAPLLPSVTLPTGRAARDEGISAFLAGHGYDGVIRSVPAPPSASRMRLDLVEGYGMPAPGRDAVESVQPEVDHVVDLVIEHALSDAERSLAVVALNGPHAERVREAVVAAVEGSPAVRDFFASDREEPFVVAEVDAVSGLRRDVVILSVGYGKTPHGRVLHRFGTIAQPDGLACLVDALDAVRQQLVLVSCLGPGDIDRSRLRQPGPRLLADLIEQAATGELPAQTADSEPLEGPDQLLVDLAERLWRLGLTVVPRYGVEGGVRIPLAIGHPDLPDELLLAVLTDDGEYVAEPSLRRRDRHWIQRLEARGWRVRMAFSAAVFMDPQAEAQAIYDEVLQMVTERRDASAESLPRQDATPAEGEEATSTEAPAGESVAVQPRERGPRPDVPSGLPLAAYSDDQLDDLASWILSDGLPRDEGALVEELRDQLALTRRGAQVDAVLGHVARRNR